MPTSTVARRLQIFNKWYILFFFLFQATSSLPPHPQDKGSGLSSWWNTSVGLSVHPSLWNLLPSSNMFMEQSFPLRFSLEWREDSERVSVGEKTASVARDF